MKYFPIFIDQSKLNVIIIGGGSVAARKVELYLKATQNITVMAAALTERVQQLVKSNNISHIAQNYQPGHLQPFTIVIAATDDEAVNKAVAEECQQLDKWVNVVDQPAICDFITPAIIDRDPMIVALSSSGSSPLLLRQLKEQIETRLPSGFGLLAEFSFHNRERVQNALNSVEQRRQFWQGVFDGEIGQAVLSGQNERAQSLLEHQLNQPLATQQGHLSVIEVNQSPDQLTLASYQAMQSAEDVFYIKQVPLSFIEYARRDAEKHEVTEIGTAMFDAIKQLMNEGSQVILLLDKHYDLPQSLTNSGAVSVYRSGH
ncbi:precorrin-2 dehydrogenase/sirohydrochlorin ferrochelatase family protein [Thalassotalea agarivorans]|uniref:precorrin-2 dehydrogenase n=1 Tax=Thalassotalea agarivorans TaxID=349064 RepID=A0A1I0HM37_THASX|nr:bifunctional precorrin-2 dehydrogenase/sirohydrochlorin ferrochelatase [Thalassotalea agarivorans]SET84976.1 precorrin-2 dehydrogenase / sirohydrochlorin ferrochelatase [Thalassotalea agarivorans]